MFKIVKPGCVAVLCALLAVAVAITGCGSSSSSSSGTGGGAETTASETTASETTGEEAGESSVKASACAMGNGKTATGTPIKIDGLVTKQPGLEGFTDSTELITAYFECVNHDGGINGHPVEYKVYTDQTDPQVEQSLGTRVLADKPDAILDGLSVLDCAVNAKSYEEAGYNVIGVGITNECFETPNYATVNTGSGSSAIATAQYLAKQGVKKLVIFTSNAPGAALINEGVGEFAEAEGLEFEGFLEDVPINDPNALALKMTQAAGEGNGVIVNFNPAETVQVLNAVTQQGLQESVKWGCPSGCNEAKLVEEIGSSWEGKIGINAEFALPESEGPDAALYREISSKYASGTPESAYAEMGFLVARIATEAMLKVPAAKVDKETINEAFKNAKVKSDLYCRTWYYGDLKYHLADNVVQMLGIENGKREVIEGCFPIAATKTNHLDDIRAYEKQNGLAQ